MVAIIENENENVAFTQEKVSSVDKACPFERESLEAELGVPNLSSNNSKRLCYQVKL